MPNAQKVFLDTSVLLTALFSSTGASAEILKLAKAEKIQVLTSQYVINEARRALQLKAPQLLSVFDKILETKIFNLLPNLQKSRLILPSPLLKTLRTFLFLL